MITELLKWARESRGTPDLVGVAPLWFRGHAQADWQLLPTALRSEFIETAERLCADLPFPPKESKSLSLERTANDRFRTEVAPFLRDADDLVTVYMEARHASLPSRLLDWTLQPLVALFFASVSSPTEDGAVFMLKPLTAYFYTLYDPEQPEKQQFMKDTVAPTSDDHIAFRGMISKLFTGLGGPFASPSIDPDPALRIAFQDLFGMPLPRTSLGGVLPVRPRHRSARLAAQRSCFTFHPPEFDGAIPEGDHLRRFAVPASAKEGALDDLRLLGIDDSSLWPGADGVSKAIRRHWDLP